MLERARQPVIVFADSDMLVGPGLPRPRGGRPWRAPGSAPSPASTAASRCRGLGGLWSRLAVGWIDHHFLPNVVVGMALGMAKPCFGSTIALRRDTLDRIGGFLAFKDRLADDYAVGEAVRALGLAVAVPPDLVLGHTCAAAEPRRPAAPGAALGAHHPLRRPRGLRGLGRHPPDAAGHAGPRVAAVAPAAWPLPAAWAVLAAAVTSRLLLQIIVDRALGAGTAGRKALFWAPSATTRLSWSSSSASGPDRSIGAGIASRSHADGSMTAPDTAGS